MLVGNVETELPKMRQDRALINKGKSRVHKGSNPFQGTAQRESRELVEKLNRLKNSALRRGSEMPPVPASEQSFSGRCVALLFRFPEGGS
jgi:hypothetical protein